MTTTILFGLFLAFVVDTYSLLNLVSTSDNFRGKLEGQDRRGTEGNERGEKSKRNAVPWIVKGTKFGLEEDHHLTRQLPLLPELQYLQLGHNGTELRRLSHLSDVQKNVTSLASDKGKEVKHKIRRRSTGNSRSNDRNLSQEEVMRKGHLKNLKKRASGMITRNQSESEETGHLRGMIGE